MAVGEQRKEAQDCGSPQPGNPARHLFESVGQQFAPGSPSRWSLAPACCKSSSHMLVKNFFVLPPPPKNVETQSFPPISEPSLFPSSWAEGMHTCLNLIWLQDFLGIVLELTEATLTRASERGPVCLAWSKNQGAVRTAVRAWEVCRGCL